jgi:hypothetical protein
LKLNPVLVLLLLAAFIPQVSQAQFTTDQLSIVLSRVGRTGKQKGSEKNLATLGPMLKSFPLPEIAPSILDFRRYSLRVPLVYDEGVTVTPIKGQAGVKKSKLGADEFTEGGVYMNMVIDDRTQCRDLVARAAKASNETYRLCVKVNEDALDYVGALSGPFRWRRDWGVFVQGGGSFITQSFSAIAGSGSGLSDYFQAAGRFGVGGWYKSIGLEVYTRSQLITFTSSDYKPLWVPVYLSYGWELPKFWGFVTPHLTLFTGFEFYRNRSTNVTNRFITDYRAPAIGFRSRFVLASRFETGGDFQYSFTSGVSKFFVQGDIRYWLTSNFALGAGYWVDFANIKRTASSFSESSFAAEGYLRYAFGGTR